MPGHWQCVCLAPALASAGGVSQARQPGVGTSCRGRKNGAGAGGTDLEEVQDLVFSGGGGLRGGGGGGWWSLGFWWCWWCQLIHTNLKFLAI